jgi:hypothetical protein
LEQAKAVAGEFSDDRRKLMVIVTDGVHNPAPGSPYAKKSDDEVLAEIGRIASEIVAMGWEIRIVRVPFTARGEQGYPVEGSDSTVPEGSLNALSALEGTDGVIINEFDPASKANPLSEAMPLVRAEPTLIEGSVDRRFDWVIRYRNESNTRVSLSVSSVKLEGIELLASVPEAIHIEPGAYADLSLPITVPDQFRAGKVQGKIDVGYGEGYRVTPQGFDFAFYLREPLVDTLFGNTLRIALIALIGVACVLLIVVLVALSMKASRSQRGSLARAASAPMGEDARVHGTSSAKSTRLRITDGVEEGYGRPSFDSSPLDEAARTHQADKIALDSFADGAARSLVQKADYGIIDEAGERLLRDKRDRDSADAAAMRRLAVKDDSSAQLAEAKARAEAEKRAMDEQLKKAARDLERSSDDDILSLAAESQRQAQRAEADAFAKIAGEEISAIRHDADDDILSEAASRKRRESAESMADFNNDAKALRNAETQIDHQTSLLGRRKSLPANAKRFTGSKIAVEMIVADQNRHVGLRNVHELKLGTRKTIGGGSSDYLVFLMKVPARIAELRFDGSELFFTPITEKAFPSVHGTVALAEGEEIELITPRGKSLFLSFRQYEAPEIQINKLLRMLDTPGVIPAESRPDDTR